MKRITGNRLRLSLLILFGWALIGWLAGALLALVGEPSFDLGGISIPKALLYAVIFLIGMSALFDSREVGLTAPISGRSLLLAWLPGLYAVCFLLLAAWSGLPSIALASSLFGPQDDVDIEHFRRHRLVPRLDLVRRLGTRGCRYDPRLPAEHSVLGNPRQNRLALSRHPAACGLELLPHAAEVERGGRVLEPTALHRPRHSPSDLWAVPAAEEGSCGHAGCRSWLTNGRKISEGDRQLTAVNLMMG
jgi:hypothetical protein